MISNSHDHYVKSFSLWLFHTTQSFCQRDSSSQWSHSVCLSALFFEFYFLCDDIFAFLMCCLYSVWLWMHWSVLKVSELYLHKIVLWAHCCWRKTDLTLCQNCLFMKSSELIAESCQTKDLMFCWRAHWW